MRRRDYGPLGYALLGLLHDNPSSGYALRKIFGATPMTAFSDSPGAIYPALRRLAADGLIRGRQEKSSGLRRRQVFHLTAAGIRALKKWLASPLSRDDVMRRTKELPLRFAFMDQVMGTDASLQFLRDLERELKAYLPTLHSYLASTRNQMPLSARLALEHGLRGYESQLEWTTQALAAYQKNT
jgi:DNA-binding PadR family transcriptional regulator